MSEWATSGGIKIERAKEHIHQLVAEVTTWIEANPYRVAVEDNLEIRHRIYRVQLGASPPLRWGAITGDVLHNLRSSLDILWRHVFPSGQRGSRKDGLPIFECAEDLEARFRRPLQGGRQTAMQVLKALKPYRGGNELLWWLHTLANEDKHNVLIPVAHAVYELRLDVFGGGSQAVSFKPISAGSGHAVQDGTEILRVPFQWLRGVYVEPEITFTIAFGEVGPAQHQPIVATLYQLLGVTEGVVEAFRRAGVL